MNIYLVLHASFIQNIKFTEYLLLYDQVRDTVLDQAMGTMSVLGLLAVGELDPTNSMGRLNGC